MANVHFGNKEEWAKKQLNQFINYLQSRNELRIMAGDFNMYNLTNYQDLYPEYSLSYNFKKYISFPEKNWCLDYFLIPKSMKFIEVQLIEKYLSDHKAVFTLVETSSNKSGPI